MKLKVNLLEYCTPNSRFSNTITLDHSQCHFILDDFFFRHNESTIKNGRKYAKHAYDEKEDITALLRILSETKIPFEVCKTSRYNFMKVLIYFENNETITEFLARISTCDFQDIENVL